MTANEINKAPLPFQEDSFVDRQKQYGPSLIKLQQLDFSFDNVSNLLQIYRYYNTPSLHFFPPPRRISRYYKSVRATVVGVNSKPNHLRSPVLRPQLYILERKTEIST